MSESHVVLADVALKLVDDLLNRSPLGDVGFLERHKLLLRVKHLALLDDELGLVQVTANWQAGQGVASEGVLLVLLEGLLVMLESELGLVA